MKKMYTKLFIMVLVCSIVTFLFYYLCITHGNFFLTQRVLDEVGSAAEGTPGVGGYLLVGGLAALIADFSVILPILFFSVFCLLVMVISQLSARLFQIGVENSWKNTVSKALTYMTITFQASLCLTLFLPIMSDNFFMLIPLILNVVSVVIFVKEVTQAEKKTIIGFILFIIAVLLTFLFNPFVGLVVAIISLVINIRERKNKKVLTFVSFIGSGLLIVGIMVSVIIIAGEQLFYYVEDYMNSQNVSDSNVSSFGEEHSSIGFQDFSEKISEDNIDEYNEIIDYIDKKVGIENYYIYDLYYVDYTGSYVIKIVLNEYYDEYRSWYKDDSSNKYIIMFSKKSNGNIEDYYDSFILGMEYEEELLNELNRISPDYQYSVEYNTFLEYSSAPFTGKTLDEAIDYMKSKDTMYLPSLNIFVPSDFSEEDCMDLIKNNKTLFEKYALDHINVCIMEDSESLDFLDFTNGRISKFNSGVAQYYSYSIDYK